MYKFLIKETESGAIATISGSKCKWWAGQKLHKSVIKDFKSRKVYVSVKDNIFATGLAEMGSLRPKNRGAKYLLFAIDVFTKYVWVKLLKDKKLKQFFMLK